MEGKYANLAKSFWWRKRRQEAAEAFAFSHKHLFFHSTFTFLFDKDKRFKRSVTTKATTGRLAKQPAIQFSRLCLVSREGGKRLSGPST